MSRRKRSEAALRATVALSVCEYMVFLTLPRTLSRPRLLASSNFDLCVCERWFPAHKAHSLDDDGTDDATTSVSQASIRGISSILRLMEAENAMCLGDLRG